MNNNLVDTTMELPEFLRTRGISEDTIRLFQSEKIDISAVLLMDEENLTKYIPLLGDRVALRYFCKNKLYPKRHSLIERLKKTIKDKNEQNSASPKMLKNSSQQKVSTEKPTRSVGIGWLLAEKPDAKFKYVKHAKGGGTHFNTLKKSLTMGEIQVIAERIFFPNGTSTKAKGSLQISDFKNDMRDYHHNPLNDQMTIRDYLAPQTGLSKLRVYLASRKKEKATSTVTSAVTVAEEDPDNSEQVNTHQTLKSRNSYPSIYSISSDEEPVLNQHKESVEVPELDFQPIEVPNSLNSNVESFVEGTDVSREYLFSLISDNNLSVIETNEMENFETLPDGWLQHDTYEITHLTQASAAVPAEITEIRLHRGQVFQELLKQFLVTNNLPENIKITMIDCRGEVEHAEDLGGVFRDTLTEFWQDFYKTCTLGSIFKVPSLRPDFGVKEWTVIAKILLLGWRKQKYFPIQLAPTFIQSCLEKISSDEDLLNNFLLYVNEVDRETLKTALSNFEAVDQNDLLDFLDTYGAKTVAKQDNLKKIVQEIAHKELIQEPCFVAKCFKPILANNLIIDDLKALYEQLQPTPRNILSRLKASYISEHVIECTKSFDYLKRFLRETDKQTRLSFLRFCTGADLIVNDIEITFIGTTGVKRLPVGHTCSSLLELPYTYESYLVLKTEMTNVLTSNDWTMNAP